jgi:hypothetical protein
MMVALGVSMTTPRRVAASIKCVSPVLVEEFRTICLQWRQPIALADALEIEAGARRGRPKIRSRGLGIGASDIA